jgi:hypothetical protein
MLTVLSQLPHMYHDSHSVQCRLAHTGTEVDRPRPILDDFVGKFVNKYYAASIDAFPAAVSGRTIRVLACAHEEMSAVRGDRELSQRRLRALTIEPGHPWLHARPQLRRLGRIPAGRRRAAARRDRLGRSRVRRRGALGPRLTFTATNTLPGRAETPTDRRC